MKALSTFRIAGHLGGFLARHFFALLLTVAVPTVLWTISYFALLLWAGLTGAGLGSPVVYPLGVALILAAGMVAAGTLFLPATALSEWFARRADLPPLAQIPLCLATFAVLCLAFSGVALCWASEPSLSAWTTQFSISFLAGLIPLGIYWWAAQSLPLLRSLFRSFRRPGAVAASSMDHFKTKSARARRTLLAVGAAFLLLGSGLAGLGHVLFSPDSARNRASAIECTLEWGRLAPIPAAARQFQISTHGTMFTRSFRASFTAPPAEIERWLQQSPGPREAEMTTPEPGIRQFEIKPGGGAMHAEVTVDDRQHLVSVYVYWS